MRNIDWMAQARCGGADWWTGDKVPPHSVVARLALVCQDCPVLHDCAAYALDTNVEGGMYAGTWVPRHGVRYRPTQAWLQAREQLTERIAPCPVAN